MRTMNPKLWNVVEELNIRNQRIWNSRKVYAENLVREIIVEFRPIAIRLE
jgi:hypothetical protein